MIEKAPLEAIEVGTSMPIHTSIYLW